MRKKAEKEAHIPISSLMTAKERRVFDPVWKRIKTFREPIHVRAIRILRTLAEIFLADANVRRIGWQDAEPERRRKWHPVQDQLEAFKKRKEERGILIFLFVVMLGALLLRWPHKTDWRLSIYGWALFSIGISGFLVFLYRFYSIKTRFGMLRRLSLHGEVLRGRVLKIYPRKRRGVGAGPRIYDVHFRVKGRLGSLDEYAWTNRRPEVGNTFWAIADFNDKDAFPYYGIFGYWKRPHDEIPFETARGDEIKVPRDWFCDAEMYGEPDDSIEQKPEKHAD